MRAEDIESKCEKVPESGCWIWMGAAIPNGYGAVRINGKNELAHRASYQHHVGDIPDGLIVRHNCDVRACCNPEHLTVGTYRDNAHDRDSRGNGLTGSDHPHAKLSEDQVVAIKVMADAGMTASQIIDSLCLDVTSSAIYAAINGNTWRHV